MNMKLIDGKIRFEWDDFPIPRQVKREKRKRKRMPMHGRETGENYRNAVKKHGYSDLDGG